MMTEGQVAIVYHTVTLRMEPCCGTDQSLYYGLKLPNSGILF